MFKKLKERKGFTLAELLVVIAILAILIAIAIPVFSNMVADANLRVNQANVHSTKSAAVTKILTNMDNKDDTGSVNMNVGVRKSDDPVNTAKEKGWVALAEVDNAGNISNLRIIACDGTKLKVSSYHDGINIKDLKLGTATIRSSLLKTGTKDVANEFYVMPDTVDTNSAFATVKPAGKTNGKNRTHYTVQAIITDLDLTAK